MTTTSKTIKASGGDYTSLSNWEAGQQKVISAGDIEEAVCYDLGAADSTAVTIDGWTTVATGYINITVAAGQRHDGKRNTGKYRLIGAAAFDPFLLIKESYVRITGLQISNTGTGSGVLINLTDTTSSIRMADTLIFDCTSSGGMVQTNGTLSMNNCAIMHNVGYGFQVGSGATATYLYNCAFVNNDTYGVQVGGWASAVLKNCYAGGNGTKDFQQDENGTLTKTTCHSADTSGDTQTAFATDSGAYFTNVTHGTEDLHIGASSALKNVGTDLSADSNWIHPSGYVDIDGDARGTGANATDVGIDEIAAAAGLNLALVMAHYKRRH